MALYVGFKYTIGRIALRILPISSSVRVLKSLSRIVGALCNGKLVNACGLGGLCKAHSNPGAHLSLSIRK
jgi:hypothetical protein